MTPRRLREPARLAGSAVLRTQSDDRLVDLVRDGNDRAFEAIVHRYRRPLQRYCGRFLTSARAEDAVQQTFVNAFGAIRSSDAEINLRPWLYRIAHNAALNVLRQAGADHDEISDQIDGVETPPQALERGERFRSVVAAVRKLPDRQRDALVLQALEGRSYDEIALELGVTGGAVRQLLNRARTNLREGVTALTPPALLLRMGGAIDAPVSERVAQAVAGAGGGAALAKVAAIIVVGGAAVGAGGDRVLLHHGTDKGSGNAAAAAVAPAKVASAAPAVASPGAPAHGETVALRTRRHHGGSHGSSRHSGTRHGQNSGRGSSVSEGTGGGKGPEVRSEVEHHGSGGSGSSGSGDNHSGSGSDGSRHSGSGDGSSGGDGHSGSGSGDGGGDSTAQTTTTEDSAPIQSDTTASTPTGDKSGSGGGGDGSGSGDGTTSGSDG